MVTGYTVGVSRDTPTSLLGRMSATNCLPVWRTLECISSPKNPRNISVIGHVIRYPRRRGRLLHRRMYCVGEFQCTVSIAAESRSREYGARHL